MAKGPLDGMKVLEIAHIMAGPVCGMMLADLGADVIKVEKTPDGEDSRRFAIGDIEGESVAFMTMNHNKRGIAVDLKHPDGVKLLRRLIAGADVVIENFRHGTMDRLGLGYDDLAKDNPGLIYCAISGFGRTGPYAERGGFDLIAQGMSGLMSITGEGKGRPPVKIGAPVTDISAGILGALGITAAYAHRQLTGKGQLVDTSLFDAGITYTYWQSATALAGGEAPGAMGTASPIGAPYQAFQASDGWITIGAANQGNWEKMCQAIEMPELVDDPRFGDNTRRLGHLADLVAILEPVFRTRSRADWLGRLDGVGVPAGPVLSINEVHLDPQTLARDMVVEVPHGSLGTVRTIGTPLKLSETPAKVSKAAPTLGQHSHEVLSEAGYTDAEIEKLAADGVIILG